MRLLIVILLMMFLALQYRLWIGEGSFAEVSYLKQEIALQKQELRAEIEDLKDGLDAVEERARNQLGMIKKGEVYFQIIESENSD